MGVKHPLEGDSYTEFSFKHPKLSNTSKQLELVTENLSDRDVGNDSPDQAEGDIGHSLSDGVCPSSADEELEENAHLSLDAGNHEAYYSSQFPRYYRVPWPHLLHFDDPYVILLNSSPRKHVPVGPDYQAEIPAWNPNNFCDAEKGGQIKFLGTSIIPWSDSQDFSKDDSEKTDCGCLDKSSIRCVEEHVEEARGRLRDRIGDAAFRDLGFSDMGETVAQLWTSEEEDLFHEVAFSHPAARGENFWMYLNFAFPTRTKKELVSYYFNVFMLRRRAAQNRSSHLMIDSDDDGPDFSFWDAVNETDAVEMDPNHGKENADHGCLDSCSFVPRDGDNETAGDIILKQQG